VSIRPILEFFGPVELRALEYHGREGRFHRMLIINT
jgi:hypothetical protein